MDAESRKIVSAWSMMGNKIDWAALETIIEYLEIKDIEACIDALLTLKEYTEASQ